MTDTNGSGRFCNKLFRNLAVSIIASKHNLFVNYVCSDLIKQLGIPLFNGSKNYNNTIELSDDNYFQILNSKNLQSNLNPYFSFFQTKEISSLIFHYINSDLVKSNIINCNPFKERYNNNNDLFIHIRLTDVAYLNPGIDYYLNTINLITHDKLFIATDEINHNTIIKLREMHPYVEFIEMDEVNTIQFGSTCKNIILSHGTFSATIGYLGFFSTIYYPEYKQMWNGDIFSINNWNKICY
jgi:hypothetical protein